MAHVGSISAPYIADMLGLVRWYFPTTICGVITIMAGLLVLLLPETEHVDLNDVEWSERKDLEYYLAFRLILYLDQKTFDIQW